MENLYKIRDFAKMLGVTTTTLRNKHKSGELVPSFVDPNSGHRFYTDECAYRYDKDKYILVYTNCYNENYVEMFHEKLLLLNIKYKMFVNKSESNDILENEALKELIKEVDEKHTYTIIYDSLNISDAELKLIKFYLNSCRSNVKLKELKEFSLVR